MNDIPIDPRHNVEVSQYADDLGLWTSAKSVKSIEYRLNNILRDLEQWCSKWRVKLNATKTQLLMISNKPAEMLETNITLFNHRIERSNEATLLGMTFDTRMTMKAHTDKLKQRAMKRSNMMKCLKGATWAANKRIMLITYKALIRPILEHGAILLNKYPHRIRELQIVQNTCLRIATGMPYRTSISDLHEETKIEYLQKRVDKLHEKALTRYKDSPLYSELKLLVSLHSRENNRLL